jgi:hypothetical protein
LRPWSRIIVTAPTVGDVSYTIVDNDSGTLFCNQGASKLVSFTLPPAIVGGRLGFALASTTAGAGYVLICAGTDNFVGYRTIGTGNSVTTLYYNNATGAWTLTRLSGMLVTLTCLVKGYWFVQESPAYVPAA